MTNPVEIDTRIAELQSQRQSVRNQLDVLAKTIRRAAGQSYSYRDKRWDGDFIAATDALPIHDRRLVQYEELSVEFDALGDAVDELQDIWRADPWSRFFLVTNTNGHIHSSTGCSTCFPSTKFSWVTSLSGQTEAEAVEELGEILCSVCFPSAPVAWTSGESKAVRVAREEREAAKAARAAKKVEKALVASDPDGGYVTQHGSYRDRVKTVAAAKMWLTDYYSWKRDDRDHPSYQTADALAIADLLVGRPGVKEETAEAVLAAAQKRAEKRR